MLNQVFLSDVLEPFISTVYMYNIVIKNLLRRPSISETTSKKCQHSQKLFCKYNVTFKNIFNDTICAWTSGMADQNRNATGITICSLYNYYSVKFCSKNINM